MIAGTKFGRNYKLQVQVSDDPTDFLTITPPFTLEFSVQRDILSSVNNANISITNLSLNHRNMLRKDYIATQTLRTVTLFAGYGQQLPIIFYGNILQGSSVRNGVDFVTTLEAQDWSFVFSNIGNSTQQTTSFGPYAANTSMTQIFTDMIKKGFQGKVALGFISHAFDTMLAGRTVSYDGMAADLLTTLSGGSFYIDSGTAYVLGQGETLAPQGVSVIDADSGLLGTPVLEETVLHFDMLFEPRLLAGQFITLKSTTDPARDGNYKVVSIEHKGTISEAICGSVITTVGMSNTKFFNGSTQVQIGAGA